MNQLFTPGSWQFDFFCLLITAVGAALVAVFIKAPTHFEAMKNLAFGVFGGFVFFMLITGKWPDLHVRIQIAAAGLCGLSGSWFVDKVFNSRDGWWSKANRVAGVDEKD